MITEKMLKNAKNYECELCNFKCSKKSNFNTHLTTLKHKRLQNNDNGSAEIIKYICDCGKEYKYRQGLYTHKKTCKGINEKDNVLLCDEKDNVLLCDNKDNMLNQNN